MENPNQAPGWVQEARERGYKDALLDVYLYLTANEQFDAESEGFEPIRSMVNQALAKNSLTLSILTAATLPDDSLSI